MSSHKIETVPPPILGPTSSDDDVIESLLTRGDVTLDFEMPYDRLFDSEKDEESLASRILGTVVTQVPVLEDKSFHKAKPGITGSAHPNLSFIRRTPHDDAMIHVVVSDNPGVHQAARAEATAVLAPHEQPEIYVVPDPGERSAKPNPGYDYI